MHSGRWPAEQAEPDIARLRERIVREFGDLPVPREPALLKEMAQPGHAADLPTAHRLRRGLAGRHWQSLTREEAKAWWSSFCYLSPAGYRYYLPALLDTALDGFHGDPAFAGTVGFSLNASCWQIYYHGRDDDMARRQDLFSTGQYETVVLFLGFLRGRGEHAHRAAMALKYAWNRHPELPAHQDAMRWYAEQARWSCPAAAAGVQALVAQIGTAFADSACPPLQALSGSGQGDEPAELALELSGLAWQTIAPSFLDLNSAALSFLSPAGLACFLPAWMRADAMGLLATDGPALRLSQGPLEGLTPRQRAAVAAYLEFALQRARGENSHHEAQPLEQALAHYDDTQEAMA